VEHLLQLPTAVTVAATKVWTPGRAAVAGLVVGIAATAAVAATWGPTGSRLPRVRQSPDAASAYIADWRRSQLATWEVVLRWRRQVGGSQLQDDVRIAQRPPDRLSVAPGAVEARHGNRSLACAPGDDGRLRCRDAGAAPPYDQEMAAGEAVLRDQLTGRGRLYDVVASSSHCYELRLRVAYPAPPYGQRARLCFDDAAGAPTVREIDRTQGRDVQEAVAVSGRVDDADLAPPPGLPG
jgi:hypothetical protein